MGISVLNARGLQYAVIDGKQRLEAVFGFFDGTVRLADDFTLYDDPTLRLAGLGYRDLRGAYPKLASRFDNFNLSVMSVITDEEAKINQLFVRLNTSRPLAGAEIRNAMGGVVPQLIRRIASHPFFTELVRFRIDRGQDRQVANKLLLIEFLGFFVDTKRTQLDRLVQEGSRAEADTDDFERAAHRIAGVLDRMARVFLPRDPLLRSQGPVTVYYWLARETPEEMLPYMREFLLQFEASRYENRASARSPERGYPVDPELVAYENMSRSTNDQRSLEGRFWILSSRFRSMPSGGSRTT